MKRKSLLFLLLMAMFAPLAMNGQGTLTVCDGTEENQYIPFYAYSGDTQGTTSEFIIPESNLTALNGKTITALKFYLSQSQSKTWTAVYKVYMTEVATTQLTRTIGPDAGTVVYQGTVDASGSEMTITFNLGNYTYNGGHLLIGTYVATDGAWDSNGKFYGITATAASYLSGSWGGYDDGGFDFIPKTTFSYLSDDPYITLAPASATVLTGFTQTLTATYGNVSGTPTITYTSSNTNVTTVSGSGTTATVTAVAPGTATITATMNGSYTATCTITVEDPHACTPTFSGSYTSYYISNFTTTGATTNINNTTSGTGLSYSDYYDTHSASAYEGQTINFTITIAGGSTYGSAIWVDWNNDFEFSDDERVHQTSDYAYSPHKGSFTVPANATAGDHRMRVVTDYYGISPSDPCSASTGEFEDYKLTVTAIPNCLPPTGLDMVANTLTGHEVTMSWNAVATNVNHQSYDLYYSTNATLPQTIGQQTPGFIPGITATQQQLTGLDPETTYYVWVRDNCGSDGFSSWSESFSFITDIACPSPTNMTANQVTNNSAVINWEGNAESYNVRYGNTTTVFFEDFEGGSMPSGWTTIDSDNDGYDWYYEQDDNTTNPYSGTGIMTSASSVGSNSTGWTALTPDNWLITPQLDLQGYMKVMVSSQNTDPEYLDDYFAIYLSTTGTDIEDFTIVLVNKSKCTNEYVPYTADLSSYAGQRGYIAIRHYDSEDQFRINIDDFGIYVSNWQTPADSPVSTNSITLSGLDAETDYEVQVQADCGSEDGTSAWVSTTFTTLDDCALPYELNVTNLTAASATLNWTGAQEAYNVQYREVITEPVNLTYDFEDGTLQGWTSYDEDGDGNGWSNTSTAHGGSTGLMARYNGDAVPNNWLISPEISLGGTLRFYAKRSSSGTGEQFQVYVSTTGTDISNFMSITEVIDATDDWVLYEYSLSNYSGNGYVAIKHTAAKDQYWLYVDDIVITRSGEYGPWVTKTNVTSPLNLDDFTPTIENGNHYLPTTYEWQVQGVNCDGNGGTTDWSASATFTTPEGYVKEITGYGTGTGNWYLIASPIGDVDPTNVTNMLSNNYDLFYFDDAKENEWVNYKDNESGEGNASTNPGFGLEKGKGYLYANSETVDLIFTGYALTTTEETVELDYTAGDGVDLPGWNLVGNPFAEIAYLAGNCAFYTMDSDGNFTSTTNASIEAMEGIFVEVRATGQTLTFTTEQQAKSPVLNLNLSNGRKVIDRAIVRFDGGKQLSKLQFRQGSTKVYIPVEGHDYAVVNSEEMGEMPVSFKAEENGTYTFSFNAEEVSFAYLHLIDNLTGAEIDLLETPSYSFEAKTTDYESRFKLVFATGNNSNDDDFAFFSNGSFVINNEGNAELQVIDLMGRIVKSESINGCANVSVNGAAGVYMLRLVNGDNVKVQKVVVR